MTDRGEATRTSGSAIPVVTAALGSFLILLTILALQMRAGHDPALKPSVAAAPQPSILERRIIKTRIIVTDAPRASTGVPAGSPGSSGSLGTPAAPAPVVAVRAAPVQAAPVAPAPAPTPAPVTRTS
jgi:hypothetical protein